MYIDERTIITLITYHAYFITTLPLLYIISGDEYKQELHRKI